MSSVNPKLRGFMPLVRGLAEMFGSNCEVVLHDLAAMPHSIIAIENGHVTGRHTGDVPTDRMLRSLRDSEGGGTDMRLYVSSQDGRILKSLAVTLRDADGRQIGVLGVNLDISEMVQAQRTLSSLTAVSPAGSAVTPETPEIFASDIREVVAGMIAAILGEMGKTPATMTRDEKRDVVRRLEERGAFLVKRSAEQVAEALDLSRYTIFSYLKEIRHRDGDGKTGAGIDAAPEGADSDADHVAGGATDG